MSTIPYSQFEDLKHFENRNIFHKFVAKSFGGKTCSELMRLFVSLLTLLEGKYSYLCYRNINVFFGGGDEPDHGGNIKYVPFTCCHILKFI